MGLRRFRQLINGRVLETRVPLLQSRHGPSEWLVTEGPFCWGADMSDSGRRRPSSFMPWWFVGAATASCSFKVRKISPSFNAGVPHCPTAGAGGPSGAGGGAPGSAGSNRVAGWRIEDIDDNLAADFDGSLSGLGVDLSVASYNMR